MRGLGFGVDDVGVQGKLTTLVVVCVLCLGICVSGTST